MTNGVEQDNLGSYEASQAAAAADTLSAQVAAHANPAALNGVPGAGVEAALGSEKWGTPHNYRSDVAWASPQLTPPPRRGIRPDGTWGLL